MLDRNHQHRLAALLLMSLVAAPLTLPSLSFADSYEPEALKSGRVDPSLHLQQGSDQLVAQKINQVIYKASGFGNTFMVVTDAGNVIIDTSLPAMAPKHKQLLTAVSDGPVHSIIITHGHGDHTGGVALWREPETQVIAQQNMVEFLNYQKRLSKLFIQRNSAQFGFDLIEEDEPSSTTSQSAGVNMLPNTLFDRRLDFTLGGELRRKPMMR